jgi:hypothetical protein
MSQCSWEIIENDILGCDTVVAQMQTDQAWRRQMERHFDIAHIVAA